MPKTHNPLQPFSGENIPQSLKDLPRWAPWKAVWSAKRGKYDKIPYRADQPSYGLSTARPDSWFSFDVALAALNANPGAFHGLGLVLTGIKGLVGTDLDNCVVNGVVAPWAQDIVNDLASYTEVSPSGNGLRVFNTGAQDKDWNNHDVGIEVYGGNDARFLTVSGQHVHSTPTRITDVRGGVLQAMEAQYAKVRVKATIIDLNMPEVLDELALPDLSGLGLPYKVADFLIEGGCTGDRSNMVFAAGCALYSAGLTDAEVFSTLCNSPHAMEVALDHRRQDQERAAMYLWREHCLKAKARASSRIASAEDFDDVSESPPAPVSRAAAAMNSVADDFEVLGSGQPATAPPKRFAFTQVMQYMARDPLTWAIKGVIPMGEVGAIYGESGAGKSFLALDLVMAVATGESWRGHRVTQGAVAYVCAEGAGGFALRAKAYADFHGNVDEATPLHILGDAPNLLEKADVKDLVAALKALGPISIIVIDTLAQSTPGSDENSSEGMGRALAHCKAVNKATKAMVLLVAHAGKDTSRGIRGWSGIKGALDVEICVERSGDKRAATITKMKDGTGEGKEYGFALDTVVLGKDIDGDDITSCVLKDGAAPVNAGGRPGSNWQQAIVDAITNLTDLAGSATVAEVLTNAENSIPEDKSTKKDRRPERLKDALSALLTNRKVTQTGDLLSLPISAGNR
jgi:hypothetical protein